MESCGFIAIAIMKALGVRSFGNSTKLELLDVPAPSITDPDDILVQVKAIGLNQVDSIRAAGYSRIFETVKSSSHSQSFPTN